jgi:hypothetical protein
MPADLRRHNFWSFGLFTYCLDPSQPAKKCGIPISIFWMHLADIIGCYCGFVEIRRRNTVFDVTSQPSSFRLFPIDLWFSPFSIGPWTNMRFIFWKNLLSLILPPHGTTVDWHSRYLDGCCRRYSYNCVVLFHFASKDDSAAMLLLTMGEKLFGINASSQNSAIGTYTSPLFDHRKSVVGVIMLFFVVVATSKQSSPAPAIFNTFASADWVLGLGKKLGRI